MKRIAQLIAIVILCTGLGTPQANAAERGRRNESTTARSSGGGRPGSNNGNHNPGGKRPGSNNGNHNPGGNRPGSNNGNHNPGGNRPGSNNGNHNHNHRPTPPPAPVHRPTPPGHHHGYGYHHIPRPPHTWIPGPCTPRFSTILGLAFGTTVNLSVNALLNSGYNVYSYGNDIVYLSNVNQLNFLWPTATLYYGNNGLARGEFVYSTYGYDRARYNAVYSILTNQYGVPYSINNISGGTQAYWYGPDGRFISLTFQPQTGYDGLSRYYTTLNFGY